MGKYMVDHTRRGGKDLYIRMPPVVDVCKVRYEVKFKPKPASKSRFSPEWSRKGAGMSTHSITQKSRGQTTLSTVAQAAVP